MTLTVEHHPQPAAGRARPRRRRFWWAAVAAVIVAGSVTTYATVRHADRQYGPIENGIFGGVHAGHDLVAGTNGLSERLSSAPGATAETIESIRNYGSHSVRITSIDTDNVVSRIRWSVYRLVPGGEVAGVRTPWREFPATVPAGGMIRLLVTIHRPTGCAGHDREPGRGLYDGFHQVHWDSLLHSHTSTVELLSGGAEIELC